MSEEGFRDRVANSAIGAGENFQDVTPLDTVPKGVFHTLLSLASNVYGVGPRPNREMMPKSTYDISRDIATDYEVAEPELGIFTVDERIGIRTRKNLYVSIKYRNVAGEKVTANFPIGYDLPDGTLQISNGQFGLDKGHFKLEPDEAAFFEAEFKKVLGK